MVYENNVAVILSLKDFIPIKTIPFSSEYGVPKSPSHLKNESFYKGGFRSNNEKSVAI